MDTVSQLEEIRDRVLSQKSGRILISMGVCGVAAGAKNTVQASREELDNRRLSGWAIVQTGCLGICDKEPLMIVEKPGESRVIYYGVNEERARQIVVNHIVNNFIVGHWVLPEDQSIYSY
ncbi:MAG: (2Fe-2S) ferredoxin domain-containing protein [Desulfitobacterium hafniense]|nr:(2Fe-2S) ferredoxin domain-containing protein [Desulfitobacterium hafniense]